MDQIATVPVAPLCPLSVEVPTASVGPKRYNFFFFFKIVPNSEKASRIKEKAEALLFNACQ
jgi:hypothetical protein